MRAIIGVLALAFVAIALAFLMLKFFRRNKKLRNVSLFVRPEVPRF